MRNRWLISTLMLAAALAAGCSIEPPLYLREKVESVIEVEADVNVNLMWQVDWEAEWTYEWDTEVMGPEGYEEPTAMSLHIYPHDDHGGHLSHSEKKFRGNTTDIPFVVGTYDLLFHNNDSEVLLFREEGDGTDDIHCYTRVISSGLKPSSTVRSLQQKSAGTKARGKAPEDEPVTYMPDGLFTLYDAGHVISENLEDYEYIDGRYVVLIKGELNPATYIHLIQVNLKNNDGRIIGSGGAVLTGVADGVNLRTRVTSSETVSIPSEVYLDEEKDMLGTRLLSFGIPGCNPYDPASIEQSTSEHCLVLNVIYANSTYKNISVDLTDQFRELPLGGVIVLDLDVNDFPPEGGETGGGGFDALITDWDEVVAGATITY